MSTPSKKITASIAPLLIGCLAMQAAWGEITPHAPAIPGSPATPAQILSTGLADAVEKVMPAVVVIRTRETRYRLAQDGFFGSIYRIPEHLAGQGSGIILTRDGYVLTNNHVVNSANEIQVVLPEGEVYPAELVGRNPQADIAVLKIQADRDVEFPFIRTANSDELRVGEIVIAIGSPFSLHSTVTMGIVSQKNRSFSQFPFVDFIQTDAAINQGNSGGPLVDLQGRMVGVNTFIQTAGPVSPGSIGIGFALPSNMAVKIARAIIETGESALPWIGIVMQGHPEGVAVYKVLRSSPADLARVRSGDIITSLGGRPIQRTTDVKEVMMAAEIGLPLPLRLLRNGEEVETTITPAALPLSLSE